jgi:hypothetical protein
MADTNKTVAELQAELETLKASNAKLQEAAAKRQVLSCKVGEKGGVSVYGLGRFPVTLYKQQWERLVTYVPTIQAFIASHPELKIKE